jgi:uncharacterized protein (DUF111 family)
MIESGGVTDRVKRYAVAIFDVIADAEAKVHGARKADVAFHEVGAVDSVVDITGTAIALDLLDIERFYCAAPHDGKGSVLCRHGVIPVPVPAVAEMAKHSDIPLVVDEDVNTEMVTPTGFGILKGLGAQFEPRIGFVPEKTGHGFGKRDTGRIGVLRVSLGTVHE